MRKITFIQPGRPELAEGEEEAWGRGRIESPELYRQGQVEVGQGR